MGIKAYIIKTCDIDDLILATAAIFAILFPKKYKEKKQSS